VPEQDPAAQPGAEQPPQSSNPATLLGNPTSQPTTTPPTQTSQATPAQPNSVYIEANDYRNLLHEIASLRDFKSSTEREIEQKEQLRLKALAEKGQTEEALNQQRVAFEKKLSDAQNRGAKIEQDWLSEKLESAIAAGLTGRMFVGEDPVGTADIVRTVLRSELEAVIDAAGKPIVRHKGTLRPASEYIPERLNSRQIAPFLAASSKGGTAPGGGPPAKGGEGEKAPAKDRKTLLEERLRDRYKTHVR
jgi:hypothetical protein